MYAISGKPVRDADKPHRVTVIQRDVQNAKQCEDDCCALAVALRRQTGVLSARVTDSFTLLETHKEWLRYRTSREARTALALFDKTGIMLSGTFILQPVRGVRRLENRGKAVRRHFENVEAGTARVTGGRGRSHKSLLASIPGARRSEPSVRIEHLPDPPRTKGRMPRLPHAEPYQTGQTSA